jgi:hypothetical protein
MSKHTPGPWQCSLFAHGHAMVSTTAFADKPCSDGGPDKVGPLPIKPSVENARLIAAAPELLAACESFLRQFDESGTVGIETIDAARAAIAKAKGQAVTA